jgi:hypothetical protein
MELPLTWPEYFTPAAVKLMCSPLSFPPLMEVVLPPDLMDPENI